MAICRSHLFSALAGSIGGITYLRNRYCAIVARARVTPVDPATDAQALVRARFSATMAAWQALSISQRDEWEWFASGTPWNNHLGEECRLTGLGIYMSIRLAALQIDPTIPSATFDSPQCTPGLFPRELIDIEPCTSGVLNQGFKITVVNNHPTCAIKLGFHMSSAQNRSINFWKGPYDNRSYFVSASILPTFGVTIAKIGLIAGSRYFLKVRVLDDTNKNLVSSDWYTHADAEFCVS